MHTCCLLCTSGSKGHNFHMLCAGREDRMGREASLRDVTVALVTATHWWWVTSLRREQSLSFSHLTHPTAMAKLPSLPRASEAVPTIPFPPTWKGWATGWDKGWSFLCLRWPPRAGLGPIHPLYPVRACVASCCSPCTVAVVLSAATQENLWGDVCNVSGRGRFAGRGEGRSCSSRCLF